MATPGSSVDLSPITFNGKEVQALSEAIMTSTFQNPALNEFFTYVTGVKAKQQVVILGLLGLAGRKKTLTQCAPLESDQTIPSIQKYWNPEHIEDRFVNCWKDLLGEFWVWGLKNGIDKPDLTNTDFANFLEERISTAELDSVWRIALFAATNASVAGSGSGTANLKAGTDVTYFNAINGFWPQAFAIVAADTAARPTYTAINRNTGANYAAQKFTAQDTTEQVITNTFQAMVDQADERLTSDPNATFWVTKSVADQYRRERKAALYIDAAYSRIENGISQLMFDGYMVKVLSIQDRIIRSYFDNGTKYDKPHRIAFGVSSNWQLGTEQVADLGNLETNYFPIDKQYYIDLLYTLDMMIVEDYKNQFAY